MGFIMNNVGYGYLIHRWQHVSVVHSGPGQKGGVCWRYLHLVFDCDKEAVGLKQRLAVIDLFLPQTDAFYLLLVKRKPACSDTSCTASRRQP